MVIDSSRSAIIRSRPQALKLCTDCPSVTTFSYGCAFTMLCRLRLLRLLTSLKCLHARSAPSPRSRAAPEAPRSKTTASRTATPSHPAATTTWGLWVGWSKKKLVAEGRCGLGVLPLLELQGSYPTTVVCPRSVSLPVCLPVLPCNFSTTRRRSKSNLSINGGSSGLLWTHSPNLVAPGNKKVARYKIVYEVPNR